MPTFLVDLTLTNRYLPEMPEMADGRHPDWELRDDWRVGGVRFLRLTRTFPGVPNGAVLVQELADEADKVFGDDHPSVVAQLAIRDATFELDDVLPYRYTKPRPRK
jgi:hypothetical protein